MTGFFTRLAQRTLGTAKTVQPLIASRFAQETWVAAEDFRSAGSIEDRFHPSDETINKRLIPETQTPVSEALQTKQQTDSPYPSKQERQPERNEWSYQQSENPHPVQQERRSQRNERSSDNSDLIKSRTADSKDSVAPIRSFEPVHKNTDAPEFLDDTGTQKVPHNDASQLAFPDSGQMRSVEGAFGEAPLVPITLIRTQGMANPDARSETLNYPPDVPQLPKIGGRRNSNGPEKNRSVESQTIKVTIGRIEVRAVHPPHTPIKRERAKPQPSLSLEGYLQQRRKGER